MVLMQNVTTLLLTKNGINNTFLFFFIFSMYFQSSSKLYSSRELATLQYFAVFTCPLFSLSLVVNVKKRTFQKNVPARH